MNEIKFKIGNESDTLPAVEAGSVLFAKDSKNLYVDDISSSNRILMGIGKRTPNDGEIFNDVNQNYIYNHWFKLTNLYNDYNNGLEFNIRDFAGADLTIIKDNMVNLPALNNSTEVKVLIDKSFPKGIYTISFGNSLSEYTSFILKIGEQEEETIPYNDDIEFSIENPTQIQIKYKTNNEAGVDSIDTTINILGQKTNCCQLEKAINIPISAYINFVGIQDYGTDKETITQEYKFILLNQYSNNILYLSNLPENISQLEDYFISPLLNYSDEFSSLIEKSNSILGYEHCEGYRNTIYGPIGHAEGCNNYSIGSCSHAQNKSNSAIGPNSTSMGKQNDAWGDASLSTGNNTTAYGNHSISSGRGTYAFDPMVLDIVNNITIDNILKKSNEQYDNQINIAYGNESVTFGLDTQAYGEHSMSIGYKNITIGNNSFTGGQKNWNIKDDTIIFGKENLIDSSNSSIFGQKNIIYSKNQEISQLFISGYENNINLIYQKITQIPENDTSVFYYKTPLDESNYYPKNMFLPYENKEDIKLSNCYRKINIDFSNNIKIFGNKNIFNYTQDLLLNEETWITEEKILFLYCFGNDNEFYIRNTPPNIKNFFLIGADNAITTLKLEASLLLGTENQITEHLGNSKILNSLLGGTKNKFYGKIENSIIFGSNNTILDLSLGTVDEQKKNPKLQNSLIIGEGNKISQTDPYVNNTASSLCRNNIVFGGNNSIINSINCLVSGWKNTITNGDQSAAIGGNLLVNKNTQVVVGSCNETDSKGLFIVGNGNAPNSENITRSNAFVVRQNGTAYLQNQGLGPNDIVIYKTLKNQIERSEGEHLYVSVHKLKSDNSVDLNYEYKGYDLADKGLAIQCYFTTLAEDHKEIWTNFKVTGDKLLEPKTTKVIVFHLRDELLDCDKTFEESYKACLYKSYGHYNLMTNAPSYTSSLQTIRRLGSGQPSSVDSKALDFCDIDFRKYYPGGSKIQWDNFFYVKNDKGLKAETTPIFAIMVTNTGSTIVSTITVQAHLTLMKLATYDEEKGNKYIPTATALEPIGYY